MQKPGGGSTSRLPRVAAPLLLFLVVVGLYSPSLRNDFIYDDNQLIVDAPAPRSLGAMARVFVEPHWHNLPYYRPIARLSMVVQKALHGDRPAPYHLFNAVLMGIAAVLAYALLRLPVFEIPSALALVGAALFAVHPIASACVYPISSGRETLMPAVFIIASLSAFLRSGGGWRALALAMFAAALLSKEQALITPGLLVLADALGFSADPPGRRLGAWVRRYAPVVAIALAYLLARSLVFEGVGDYRIAVASRPMEPLLSVTYTLQTALMPFVELAYEPREEVWNSGWRRMIWPILVVLGAVAVYGSWPRVRTRVLFWSGWAVLSLLPTANLLRQQTRFAERYGFLSLLGIVAIASVLASTVWERPRTRRWLTGIGVALVVASAAISAHRVDSYANHVAFLEQWLRSDPEAPQPHFSLGGHYDRQGELARAAFHYRRALAVWPVHAKANRKLGVVLLKQGELELAAAHLERAVEIESDSQEAHHGLGVVYLKQGRLAAARTHFERAAAIDPDFARAHQMLGITLTREGRFEEALEHLGRALELRPGLGGIHGPMAVALSVLGREEEAEYHRRQAARERRGDAP